MSKLTSKFVLNNIIIFGSFTILVIVLLNLPLTNITGFDFSLVVAIFLSFFGGLLFYILNNSSIKYKNQFFSILNEFKIYLILLPLIPLILSLISTVYFQNCPLDNGIWFYIIISIVSYIFGIAISYFSICLSDKFGLIIFIFIFLLFLFSWIPEIYSNPQIYFYNPILGFYPGTLYDEDILINFNLILYRLITLFFAFLIVGFGRFILYSSLSKRIFGFLFFIAFFLFFYFVKPALGFSTTDNRLIKELHGKIETRNFTIIFSEDIPTTEIKEIAFLHEYYYQKLKTELKINDFGKIESFVFSNGKQKRELFGANRADVAKPWLSQIYLNKDDLSSVLKHELTHVFTADFGSTIFKLSHNFNPALLEGFAMAIENNYQDYPVHYLAALAFNYNVEMPIEKLFSGFNFFGNTSSLSYIVAGSFIKYLIDTYGIDKVKMIYSDGDLQSNFGKSIGELSKDYKLFIKGYTKAYNKNTADYFFGRIPIFKKFCARYTAKQLKKAREYYRKGYYNQSTKIFGNIFNKTNSASSLIGLTRSLMRLKNNNEAVKLLENHISKFEKTAYYFNIELLYADNLIVENKFKTAYNLYYTLLKQNPTMQYKNLANLRLKLYNYDKKLLQKYIQSSEFDKFQILKNYYQKARNLQCLSTLIYLSSYLNENYKDLKKQIGSNLLISDDISAYSAFNLAEYALINSDYNWAEILLIKIQKSRKLKFFSNSVREKLGFINWLKEKQKSLNKIFYLSYY